MMEKYWANSLEILDLYQPIQKITHPFSVMSCQALIKNVNDAGTIAMT